MKSLLVALWGFVVVILAGVLFMRSEQDNPAFVAARDLPANYGIQAGDAAPSGTLYTAAAIEKGKTLDARNTAGKPRGELKPGQLSVALAVPPAGRLDLGPVVRICQDKKTVLDAAPVRGVDCATPGAACIVLIEVPAENADVVAKALQQQRKSPLSVRPAANACT